MPEHPTQVEVVRGPRKPGFFRRFFESIPIAIVTSILTAFFLALYAPKITSYVALFRPTCADPEGLVEVPHGEITVEEVDGSGPESVLLDGRVVDIWMPAMLEPEDRPKWMSKKPEFAVVDPRRSTLTMTLDSPEDVQLVCVVNGLANGYSNYVNYGRVRTVHAWTDTNSSKEVSVLKSLDEASFQSFQDVSVPPGDASQIMVQVVELYEGQQTTSVDPDRCGTRAEVGEGVQNDPVGCNFNADPHAGLAEVKVYRQEDGRWRTLLPF